jgi:hypothetical protein
MDDGVLDRLRHDLRVEVLAPEGVPDAPSSAAWSVEVAVDPGRVAGTADVEVTVRYAGQDPIDRAIRVSLVLTGPPRAPHWLVPGLFYGENRPAGCRVRYPRWVPGPEAVDEPLSASGWSFRADRAATPAVFAWTEEALVMLATTEETELGAAGVGFSGGAVARDPERRIWVDAPFREEPVAYDGDGRTGGADVRTHRWVPGDVRTLRLRAAIAPPDAHGYAPLVRALGAEHPAVGPDVPWVSIAEAGELAADGLLTWHYHPEDRALYETAAFERDLDGTPAGPGDRPHMHVGWVSGIPWAAQLVAWGRRVDSDAHVAAGIDVIDHVCDNLAPSGTFWASWTREGGWGTGWSPAGTIHANTIGQATLFLLRALEAEDAVGIRHPTWEAAARSNLEAITARQRPDGALGTYHDAVTGDVTEWDGAGALPWIAALLAGGSRWSDPRYRAAAERAGHAYRRYVDDELIYGAPEDVHLAPTSEDGYNAVLAYVALHHATADPAWLDVARRAADWMLTFRYSYDVAFAPDTLLGRYGFRTRGTDQASPANQHLHHFGLLVTPELVRLARATGDDHYRQQAVEALRAWRQGIVRRDGDLNGRRGMVSERFHQTDCFRPKGSLLPLSHAWTGGVLLFACLAAMEDPDALPE